jgi:hypothetical protein
MIAKIAIRPSTLMPFAPGKRAQISREIAIRGPRKYSPHSRGQAITIRRASRQQIFIDPAKK